MPNSLHLTGQLESGVENLGAMSNDQRFVVLLLLGLACGAWLIGNTAAQTFSPEDRGSILKFMDVLMNFLDAETDNSTSTESPTGNATTTADPLGILRWQRM